MPALPEDVLARFVLDRVLKVRPGESVGIEAWSHALPWARSLVVEARRRHADPALIVEDEEAFFRSLRLLPRGRAPRTMPALAQLGGAYVYLPGPEAFPRLFGLPPVELATVLERHPAPWSRNARSSRMRVVRLRIAGVTPSAAHRYRVDLEGWRRQMLLASRVAPERLASAGVRLVRRLARARRVRIRHPNGTDLVVRLVSGRWALEDGRLDRHSARGGPLWTDLPTGLVASAIMDGSAGGVWEANRPNYDRFAEPSIREGARFVFAGGRLRSFSFERGGESFAEAYAHGGGGRDRPVALTFGLNPGVKNAPEIEELGVDAVGVALGEDRWFGGRNRRRFSYLSVLRGADVEFEGGRASRDFGHRSPAR